MKGRWTPIIQTEVSDGLPVSGYANMVLHPAGDYVQYDDYAAMEAQYDAFVRTLSEVDSHLDHFTPTVPKPSSLHAAIRGQSKDDAFKRGFDDEIAGISWLKNPYPENSVESRRWVDGKVEAIKSKRSQANPGVKHG